MSTVVGVLLLALFALEVLFFLFFRIVNLDEGWYLWAGKLVFQGQLPYRDFAYTQTPLLPYVYGLFQRILGEGLYQGRVVSSVLCVATATLCTQTARRRMQQIPGERGDWAAVGCALFFLTTLYASVHLTYTATYPLATFWLALALYSTVLGEPDSASNGSAPPLAERSRLVLATVCMCLAVATRMSSVAALPPLALYLVLSSQRRWHALFLVALTGATTLLLLLAPFWFASEGRMVYHIFGFHTDRILSTQRQVEKAWITTKDTLFLFGAPLTAAVLGGAATLWRRIRPNGAASTDRTWGWAFEWMLAGMVLLPWILHLVPRTTASYYNMLQAPTLCVLGGLGLARLAGPWRKGTRRSALGFTVLAVLFGGINLAANGYGVLRDGLVRIPPQNQIEVVRSAADFLRQTDVTDGRILTLNTHLALEADMEIPHGYEMSIFAYRPTWSTEHALRYNAVNNELFLRDLEAGADAVAITDFDLERFYGERQQIFESMWANYRFAKTVPGFDPFGNNLYIYLRPQFDDPQPDVARKTALANDISLLGYDLDTPVLAPDEPLRLGLYWQAQETPELSYTVFVHLINEAGEQVAGWDNPPCRTVCRTDTWLPGEVVRDDYVIPPGEPLVPGSYQLYVGMYYSDTGDPVFVSDPNAPPEQSSIELGTVTVE